MSNDVNRVNGRCDEMRCVFFFSIFCCVKVVSFISLAFFFCINFSSGPGGCPRH